MSSQPDLEDKVEAVAIDPGTGDYTIYWRRWATTELLL